MITFVTNFLLCLPLVEELEEEGKTAIDGPTIYPAIESPPEEYVLNEYEERSMVEPSANENKDYQELVKILINWIKDELRYAYLANITALIHNIHYNIHCIFNYSDERIIVTKLDEDLYDGQILGKLVEKLR